MTRGPCRTTACSRRPPASASLRLPGVAEAQRSAAPTQSSPSSAPLNDVSSPTLCFPAAQIGT